MRPDAAADAPAPLGGKRTAALALLVFAWLAAMAWPRPLMLPDEGRYVGVAWEMMRSGDWLVPTLNGLPYFHKPPLFYWITAGSMSLFGPGDWTARAAPLIGATLGAVAIFLFVHRWWGRRAASLTLVALLAQPLFYLGGQFANLDMLVAGCITATVAALAHCALCMEQGSSHRRWLATAYAMAAASVLAKGLIGVVLPALVIGAWLLSGGRWRTLVRLLWWPGILLFLAIALPWFIAMQWRFPAFFDYFFVVQHFARFAHGGFNNAQPFWFYPAVLALFTLPWWPWLRPHVDRHPHGSARQGDLRRLMLVWVAVVVGFFSLPESKLLGYVLPAVPPLAALLADVAQRRVASGGRAARGWWTSAGVAVAVSLIAVLVLAARPPQSTKEIGKALREARASKGDAIFMLDDYYFDLPLYARLSSPVAVVLDWSDDEVRKRDSWRKELADAEDFSPARGHALLLEPRELASVLCAQPVNWLIGPSDAGRSHSVLTDARVVASAHGTTLWRLDRAASPACPRAPDAGRTGAVPLP